MTTKSSLKKLMALNLALIMIFSSIGFTFAAENDVGENYYAYYEQDVPDKEDGDEALNNEDDAEIPGEDEGIEAPGEEDIEAPGEECDNEASGEEDIEAPETESPESPTVSGEQAIIATSVVTTWEQLQAAVWNHAVSTIVLGADITAHVGSASLWIDRAVRIEGQHNLFLDAGMIWIEDSGHLTLDGPIVRPNPSDSLRSAIFVSGGTFTLESGTVFGNTNVDSVYVGGQGTFNMMGGALENLDPANTTSTGVLLISGGIFNMSGGIISGFQWPIFMMSNQAVSVNMTGGTITDSGSVNVSPGSSFNMQGGYITNLTNFLSVSVMGEFTMNGGNIHSNDEHGVVVGGNGRFTMNGGIIRDNHWSGVIVLPDGVFTMNDGSIHNNGYGGVGTWGEFIMNGGSIRYNEDSGVNILTSTQFNGRFTMNGGEIRNNTSWSGGGILVNWNNVHNLTISPTATIANNSANQTFAVTAADRQHLRGLGFVDSVIDLFDNNNISYTRGTVVTPDARNVTINIAGIGQVNFADDGWWIPAVDGETFQAVPGDWVLIRTLPWNMFAFDGFITNPPNLQIDTWYTDEFGWTWWEFQMPNQDVEITVNFVSNHPDGHSFLRVYGVGPSGTIFWSHGQFLPAGERVILLNNPVSGHRFDRWEVASGGGILEVVDSQTQFIMPATDAVIRGVYVADPNAPAINITSNDEQLGWVSYSLFFDEDGLLWARINADVAWDVEGIMFDRWEIISGNITIDDLNRPSTSFPMPETGHVEIRAIFREMVNPQTVTVSTNNVVWGQAILDGYWAGAAGLSRQFEPGRTIRLDAWASSGQLVRWETLPDIELTYVETVDSLSHFTFVMPAHDVNIAGIFGPLFEIEYEDIVTDAIEDALPPGDSANLTFVDDMIKGIPPGIATSILAELPEVAAVLNADGSPRPANAPLGSGTRIRFTNYAELEVVVFGDVLGTGVIDVWGIVQIMAYLERLVGEGDLHRIAADVNDTGGIDVWDIVQIRMFLEGMIDSLGN